MEIKNDSVKFFQANLVPADTKLAGYTAIVNFLGINAPVKNPACVSSSYVRGSIKQEDNWKIYDKRYMPDDTLESHLTFALKHENIDLLVLKRIFQAISKRNWKK